MQSAGCSPRCATGACGDALFSFAEGFCGGIRACSASTSGPNGEASIRGTNAEAGAAHAKPVKLVGRSHPDLRAAHRRSQRANRPRLSSGGGAPCRSGTTSHLAQWGCRSAATSCAISRHAWRPNRRPRASQPSAACGRHGRRRSGTAPAIGARRCRLPRPSTAGRAVSATAEGLDRRLHPRPTAGPFARACGHCRRSAHPQAAS